MREASIAVTLVLTAWLGAVSSHAQPAPEQPHRYAVHNTGLLCTRAPCFSYCARDLATGQARRFSQLGPPSLSMAEQRTLSGFTPVIVEGELRKFGTAQWAPVELTVLNVIRQAPELERDPGKCE